MGRVGTKHVRTDMNRTGFIILKKELKGVHFKCVYINKEVSMGKKKALVQFLGN